MKVKYKHIVGSLIAEKYLGSCAHCCLYSEPRCIPSYFYRCRRTIFKESESQVFEV